MMSSRLVAQSATTALRRQIIQRQRQLLLHPPTLSPSVRFQSTAAATTAVTPSATSPRRRRGDHDNNNTNNNNNNNNNNNYYNARRDGNNRRNQHRSNNASFANNNNNNRRRQSRDGNYNPHHGKNYRDVRPHRRFNGTPRAYQKRHEDEEFDPGKTDRDQYQWRRENQSARKVIALHADLSTLMRSYEQTLFQSNDEKKEKEVPPQEDSEKVPTTGDLMIQVRSIRGQYNDDFSNEVSTDEPKIPWSKLEETEQICREACGVLQQLISTTTLRGDAYSADAEQYLRILTQFRSDRALLVDQLAPLKKLHEQQSDGVTSKVMNWFSSVFVSSADGDEKDKAEPFSVSAHADLAYAPRKRNFKDIIVLLFHEGSAMYRDRNRFINRADRIAAILELVPDGMEVNTKALSMAIQAHGSVGKFNYAQKAEKLWRDHKPDVLSHDLLYTVVRAYGYAAFREHEQRIRSKAGKSAEQLVLQEWKDKNDNTADSSRLSFSQYSTKCIHYGAAIKALSIAGRDAIPEVCERAENLAIKCLGKRVFASLFANDATGQDISDDSESSDAMRVLSDAEMQLLHYLLTVYTRQRTLDRLDQARTMLRSMEIQYATMKLDAQKPASRRNTSADQGDPFEVNSLLETYRHMLAGIRSLDFRNSNARLLEMVDYSNGIIEKMASLSIIPDVDIYERLLIIWQRCQRIESGERAEDILSRMQLREIYDPTFRNEITVDHYEKVLQCWRLSALESHPQAAERADQLLRFMEARSGMHSISLAADVSSSDEEEKELFESITCFENVYKENIKPTVRTYNAVLRVCSDIQNDESKERAVEIAFDVAKRLQHNYDGIRNDTSSCMSLFFAVSKLLPSDSPRRMEIVKELSNLAGGCNSDAVRELKKVDKGLARGIVLHERIQAKKISKRKTDE